MRKEVEVLSDIEKALEAASESDVNFFINHICKNLKTYDAAGFFGENSQAVQSAINDLQSAPALKISLSKEIFSASFNGTLETLYKRVGSDNHYLKQIMEEGFPILKGKTPASLVRGGHENNYAPTLSDLLQAYNVKARAVLDSKEVATFKDKIKGDTVSLYAAAAAYRKQSAAEVSSYEATPTTNGTSTVQTVKSFFGWTA